MVSRVVASTHLVRGGDELVAGNLRDLRGDLFVKALERVESLPSAEPDPILTVPTAVPP